MFASSHLVQPGRCTRYGLHNSNYCWRLDIASNENITILRDLDDIVCTLTQPSAPAEEEAEEGEETEAPEALKQVKTKWNNTVEKTYIVFYIVFVLSKI